MMVKVVMFASKKGVVGKITTVIHLVTDFALGGPKNFLADNYPQGSVTTHSE